MTEHRYYRPASIHSLFIAILVLTVMVLTLAQLPEVVKQLGEPLLFVPTQLGLVRQVSRADLHVIEPFETSPRLLILSQPGRYAVYTGDLHLLERINALVDHQGSPLLGVKSDKSNASIAVAFVERGLRPYDTPLAEGRPVFTFVIDTPGRYTLQLPEREGSITVVPDYTTGNESIILLAMVAQLGIAGAVAGGFVYVRTEPMRLRRRQQAAIDAQRQAQGEAFWQSEIQRSKDAGEMPD
jgi:hypothetical protein